MYNPVTRVKKTVVFSRKMGNISTNWFQDPRRGSEKYVRPIMVTSIVARVKTFKIAIHHTERSGLDWPDIRRWHQNTVFAVDLDVD